MDAQQATGRYAGYFANLTPDNVGDLRSIATGDILFKDPFNEITGVDRMIGLLSHMFETTHEPKFIIRDQAFGTNFSFISWDFTCSVNRLGPLKLVGASEIRFAEDWRASAHIDHWDAAHQLYEKLPLLGRCLKFCKGRLAYPG